MILLSLSEAEYQTNNSIVKRAIREALEQQGQHEVRLGKVQAYVLEALGVNLSKETLRPIVKFMLDEFAYERDRNAAEAIGQLITTEYLRRKHSSYMSPLEDAAPTHTPADCWSSVVAVQVFTMFMFMLLRLFIRGLVNLT